MKNIFKFTVIFSIVAMLNSCATAPPKNPNNACSIITQKPNWYYAMIASYNRWGVPLNIQLAFIRQESSFRSDAKPSMQYYLGFIPRGRASSAYGYAQALDGTWDKYKQHTNQTFVSRSNFSDAADFIGWYIDQVHNKTSIKKTDAYDLYIAYHEGIAGFKSGKYKSDYSLMNYAHKTAEIAQKYSVQLRSCKVPRKPWF